MRIATLPATLAASLLAPSLLHAQGADPAREGLPGKSERIVSYEMRVRLYPEEKKLLGTQRIRYRNRTSGWTDELRFHLYLNAFRNLGSTHLRESGKEARKRYEGPEEFGDIRFTRLELTEGGGGPVDLLPDLRYEAPEDGNPHDRTVAVVPLPGLLESGGSLLLETRFEAKLPKAYRRTGWGPGNFFMLAQWFPKLGVLEDPEDGEAEEGEKGARARWNCHQFHAWTEFYADYGRYDVHIEVPRGFKVGATGKEIGTREVEEGYVDHHFVQEDVHDFAWVTDPDYRVHEETIQPGLDPETAAVLKAKLGYDEKELALTPVFVRYLIHPEHDSDHLVARHKRAVRIALEFFGSRFGRYPYETLTVVDPSRDSKGRGLGGGMEYPTLITCGSPYFPHSNRLSPEGVTIHEFGHQFWFGLSGNNEFEESWLDEGINSYSEGRAQDLAYREVLEGLGVGRPLWTSQFGPFTVKGGSDAKLGFGGKSLLRSWILDPLLPSEAESFLENIHFEGNLLPSGNPLLDYLRVLPFLSFERDSPRLNLYADRNRFLRSPMKDPVVRPAWTYMDRDSYRVNSYQRPSTILSTLERMMDDRRGRGTWISCMRRFHERARFAHPTTEDFLATVGEFGGSGLEAFAREALYSTKTLDYGITVESRDVIPPRGIFDEGEDPEAESGGETIVTVRRIGEMRVPVLVRLVFEKEGGEITEDHIWEAEEQGPWKRFVIPGGKAGTKGRLVRAYVDPPRKDMEPFMGPAGIYILDANLLNNAWQREPDPLPAGRRALKTLIWCQAVCNFFGAIG